MAHTYRYLFTDLLTGTTLEELPLDCQSLPLALNGGDGQTTGTLNLADLNARGVQWRAATEPERTGVYAVRDDTSIVWGGYVEKRRPTNGGATAELTCKPFEALLARTAIDWDVTYTATDVFDIVRGLLSTAQGQAGGNLRIDVNPASTDAGLVQTIAYVGREAKPLLGEIQRLAEAAGFEFFVSYSRDPVTGIFGQTLNLGAPTLNAALSPIVATFPGGVIDYDHPEDASKADTVVNGYGTGTSVSQLYYQAVDTDRIAAGYPRLSGSYTVTDEDNQARLTTRTTAEQHARVNNVTVPTVTIGGDFEIPLLGQPCRLMATSDYHPSPGGGAAGLDDTRRITAITIRPPGGQAEQMMLSLSDAAGKPVPAVNGAAERRLRRIEQQLRALQVG